MPGFPLSRKGHVAPTAHPVLARLSAGCPGGKGRSHTCYSPVRRSPAPGIATGPAAPRLACVKPAASVHPEPGSNSPLYLYLFSLFFSFPRPAAPALRRRQPPRLLVLCLPHHVNDRFSMPPGVPESGCKYTTPHPFPPNITTTFFQKFFRQRHGPLATASFSTKPLLCNVFVTSRGAPLQTPTNHCSLTNSQASHCLIPRKDYQKMIF